MDGRTTPRTAAMDTAAKERLGELNRQQFKKCTHECTYTSTFIKKKDLFGKNTAYKFWKCLVPVDWQ